MQFFENNTTIYTIVVAVLSGIFGGGIWQLIIKSYLDSKQRSREQVGKARKIMLKLMPLLKEAAHSSKSDLSDSLYLRDIKDEIREEEINTTKARPFNPTIAKIIEESNLSVIRADLGVRIANIEAEFRSLNRELSDIQSSGCFLNTDERDIARNAKKHCECRLSDILIDLQELRKSISLYYFGRKSLVVRDRKDEKHLVRFRNDAYNHSKWAERIKNKYDKLKHKLLNGYVMYRIKNRKIS